MAFSAQDYKYMQLCFKLALKGQGLVSPNPMVGAVIVKNGKIIATGFHAHYGKLHAERDALKNAGNKARGATLYCNLEPCFETGKQPPCTEAIIKAGIKKVFFAQRDLSDKTGAAVKILKNQGIQVSGGLMEKEALQLNHIFNFYAQRKKILVGLKVATSLDGKIATAKGESKWITSPDSRKLVQELRKQSDAILVGINTVIADNPRLLVKGWPAHRQPLRCVLDSRLRIPLKSKILNTRKGDVMILTTNKAPASKVAFLKGRGIGVKVLDANGGHVNLKSALAYLKQINLCSVLIEGGAEINRSFMDQKLVDELWWFMAPSLIPGQNAKVALGGLSIDKLKNKMQLKDIQTQKIGPDLLIAARF